MHAAIESVCSQIWCAAAGRCLRSDDWSKINPQGFIVSTGAALAAGGMYPSLYGVDGGGLETCGITLAVRRIVQSDERQRGL